MSCSDMFPQPEADWLELDWKAPHQLDILLTRGGTALRIGKGDSSVLVPDKCSSPEDKMAQRTPATKLGILPELSPRRLPREHVRYNVELVSK